MKLAAVDIGSNAVRLQISRVTHADKQPQFKKIEYIRFPLALGREVFKRQYISSESERKLIQLLQAFKLLIDLHEVDNYMICATSSWREASNRLAIKARIEKALGLVIHIIDGEEEADLINRAVQPFIKEEHYLHIDVGGGSTELSFYEKQKKVATRSFKLGSIRDNSSHEASLVWVAMQAWIYTQKQYCSDQLLGIATGGNIRKLVQLADSDGKKIISLKRLIATQKYLASYSLAERIHILQLNSDRAEIILHAAQIYLTAMQWSEIEHTLVPDMGLKDGIIHALYEERMRVS